MNAGDAGQGAAGYVATAGFYTIGVMWCGSANEEMGSIVEDATSIAIHELADLQVEVRAQVFEDAAMPLAAPRVDPLDWLEIGLSVKVDRSLNFLLIVSDMDIATTKLSYAVAYPSRLTNVGMISIRRLGSDWGESLDRDLVVARLKSLMLHTLGHILNLSHAESVTNYMHDFNTVEDLDHMTAFDREQLDTLDENFPAEAHDETRKGSSLGFWWSQVMSNLPVIMGTLIRASPFRLLTKLPTTLTAALSVVVVLFFSAEIWDVADAVEIYQVIIFAVLAFLVATVVLYKTFGFRTVFDRDRLVSESTVVTQTATALAVAATILVIFALFFGITFLAAVTIFPRALMAEWASVDAATDPVDHVKLGLFLGGMAVLTGSLGGRSDNKRLFRTILFLDEET